MQTLQFILTDLDSIENILVLFSHSFYIYSEKINLYTLIKLDLLTKINKPNIKIYAHRIICIVSINTFSNIFISSEFSNFFWNMFNWKAIIIGYIIIINIQKLTFIDVTIFIMSSISSFKIINAVVRKAKSEGPPDQ